jgi:hypothetical protein
MVAMNWQLIKYFWIMFFHVTVFDFWSSVVKGLESMTYNPVTSLAWVRLPGDALVVKRGES